MSKFLQSGEHPDADQISAFVDRVLPPHEREEMLAHLAECADCREAVALSLPPIEDAQVAAGEKRKPWLWELRRLWPAAAAAGLTIALLYVYHAENTHRSSGSGRPEVARQTAPAGAAHAEASRVDRIPSGAPTEKPHNLKQRARAGVRPGADAMQRLAQLHLPGGAAPISMAARGPQVLALDARNEIFLSNDRGKTWTAVQVPWSGRAVKAELVSYPAPSTLGESVAATGKAQSGEDKASESAAAPTQAVQEEVQVNAATLNLAQPSAPNLPPGPQANLASGVIDRSGAAASGTDVAAASAPAPSAGVLGEEQAESLVLNSPSGSQANLTGSVTDRTGAVVPRAQVTATGITNHAAATVETDSNGQYRFQDLKPGVYGLKVQSPGFQTADLPSVEVAASKPNVANLTLAVGEATEAVNVDAAAASITTLPPPGNGPALDTMGEPAPSAAPSHPEPVFVITTDTGDRWMSADGVHWHRQ